MSDVMDQLINHRIPKSQERWAAWIMILALIGFAVLLFRQTLVPDYCLFTTDNNIGSIKLDQDTILYGWVGAWYEILLGIPGGAGIISWNFISLCLMPLLMYVNWVHAADLIVASLFVALILRGQKIGWFAIVAGLLTAFWLASNLTLTYAGHLGKYGVMVMASMALYFIWRALSKQPSVLWSILAGGAIGYMFMEQLDVALFFGFMLGAYALFFAVRQWNLNRTWVKSAIALFLMGGVGLLIAGSSIFSGYASNVKGASTMQSESPQEKWEYVTQWSWPPEECIDFIAPGYMGWRSGEPVGPYWGRMGRSAGWEKTGQGFMNFKLENMYIGIIPILLALFAILMGVMGEKTVYPQMTQMAADYSDRRAEIIFWGCVAVITLLLAFGKFFPLYALFYKLPLVNSIRNPNKFLQIFQLALGVLAAYGLDALIKQYWQRAEGKSV